LQHAKYLELFEAAVRKKLQSALSTTELGIRQDTAAVTAVIDKKLEGTDQKRKDVNVGDSEARQLLAWDVFQLHRLRCSYQVGQ
jgi:hypothetical protein